MRITIVANDTRGGVEPYAALARGLDARGHSVVLVAPDDFRSVVTGSGVTFAGLSGSSQQDLASATGATERGPVASMRIVARELGSRIRTWTAETLQASEGSDLMLGGVGGMVVGLAVAEKLGVPFIPAHLQPVDAPTGDYPGALLPGVRPYWLGNRLTSLALWTPFLKPMADARREILGLAGRPPRTNRRLALYAISRRVLQVPGADNHTTGYWFSELGSWAPSADLEAFVSDGPVVSIGFGSMATRDPGPVAEAVREALVTVGTKAVLLAGSGGFTGADFGPNVMTVDSVPHEWLFARMSAVVHHGGAGTTAAGLRAGVPNIIVPFTVDQPFWGSQVARLGVAPVPIPRRRLTGLALARAIRVALDDDGMRDRARTLSTAIGGEDGIATAIRILEQNFG